VVVLIHGITQDRSSLLLLASELANACNRAGLTPTPPCFASVMIDLPLHGHTSIAANPVLDIASSDTATTLASDLQLFQERHFGLTFNPASTDPATRFLSTQAAPSSGSLFINLANFQNTRDHLKQAVMDQLNLLSSIATMDTNSDSIPDFNTNQVYLVGHSLGAMVGVSTAAIANSGTRADLPRVQAAGFLNAGGQITRLLENSPNITFGAPAILAGLASQGLVQNTKNYETFFNTFQATIDSADPINFASQLNATQTPSYFMVMDGNGSASSSDQVVPVDADSNPNAPLGDAQAAPLAGTNPLIRLSQAVEVSSGAYSNGTEPALVAVRFSAGQHSTAALPADATEVAIFQDMINHLSTFFASNGRSLDVTNLSGAVK